MPVMWSSAPTSVTLNSPPARRFPHWLISIAKNFLSRGWTEDESAAEIEADAVELTFKHDEAQIEMEFDADSDGVDVSFDCEGLDFSKTGDPAALIAAGVPQPHSYVFLQKELPRPTSVQDVQYSSDACHFKSTLALADAFGFFDKSLKGSGWRETVQAHHHRRSPV